MKIQDREINNAEEIFDMAFKDEKNYLNKVIFRSEESKKLFSEFLLKNSIVKKIIYDLDFNDFKNEYDIYETDKYYIIHIIQECFALGTPDADVFGDSPKRDRKIIVESKDWISKYISLQHWEDGTMNYKIYDIYDNRAKYMLELKPNDEGIIRFDEEEYRDFGCKYDRQEYDKMWYKRN